MIFSAGGKRLPIGFGWPSAAHCWWKRFKLAFGDPVIAHQLRCDLEAGLLKALRRGVVQHLYEQEGNLRHRITPLGDLTHRVAPKLVAEFDLLTMSFLPQI